MLWEYCEIMCHERAFHEVVHGFFIEREEMKMRKFRKNVWKAIPMILVLVMMVSMTAFAAEEAEYVPSMYATFWSLVPPLVAIALALITKEVYSSLFVGILVGALFYSGFTFEGTVMHIFNGGFIAVLTDSYNMGILIFLVILGAMVCLMNRAGGSAAFGAWASKHIKSRVGAQLATIALGVLIFIDDYFNCLTVGSVMRPVTDKAKISRSKLAYVIDATAAPICIIAPISSWAAAVAGFANAAGAESGIALFIQAIPFNFYALLTIVMMIFLAVTGLDFGKMKTHEENAKNGDLFTSGQVQAVEEMKANPKGKVILESSELANGPGHHGYINIPGTDEWRIVYHRRIIGDLEAGHRVLCMDQLHFDGDEIVPVTMT
mgnify:CR=1 FL=1